MQRNESFTVTPLTAIIISVSEQKGEYKTFVTAGSPKIYFCCDVDGFRSSLSPRLLVAAGWDTFLIFVSDRLLTWPCFVDFFSAFSACSVKKRSRAIISCCSCSLRSEMAWFTSARFPIRIFSSSCSCSSTSSISVRLIRLLWYSSSHLACLYKKGKKEIKDISCTAGATVCTKYNLSSFKSLEIGTFLVSTHHNKMFISFAYTARHF